MPEERKTFKGTAEENLSFPQSSMKACVELCRTRRESSWPQPLTEEQATEWADVTSKRFRAMCRSITQTEKKSPKIAWLGELWGAEGRAVVPTEAKFFYGFDFSLKFGWRQPVAGGRKEFAKSIVADGTDDDFVKAVFGDKEEVELPDVTVAQWRTMQATDKEFFWQQTLDDTPAITYTVAKRKDSTILISLFKQVHGEGPRRQILQVKASNFDDGTGKPEEHYVGVAFDKMVTIAKKLAGKSIREDDLMREREAILPRNGSNIGLDVPPLSVFDTEIEL